MRSECVKVAISTSAGGLEDVVCPVFGRCPTFTIVDADEKSREIKKASVLPNPGFRAGGGAGIAAAQEVVNAGADAVITGNCGPNALGVLAQAGVRVYFATGNVKKAVGDLLGGKLQPLMFPTVPGHFGMGWGARARRGFRGGRR